MSEAQITAILAGKRVIHIASPADRVPQLMGDLFHWLVETGVHPLIVSSVFHYEFEYIHPFADPVPSREARQLGAALISLTCNRTRQLSLSSDDRLFPNQDTLPKGGFGSLIARPLQKQPREHGHSLPAPESPPESPVQDVFRILANDATRNQYIAEDVSAAYREGRKILVLTSERTICRCCGKRWTMRLNTALSCMAVCRKSSELPFSPNLKLWMSPPRESSLPPGD